MGDERFVVAFMPEHQQDGHHSAYENTKRGGQDRLAVNLYIDGDQSHDQRDKRQDAVREGRIGFGHIPFGGHKALPPGAGPPNKDCQKQARDEQAGHRHDDAWNRSAHQGGLEVGRIDVVHGLGASRTPTGDRAAPGDYDAGDHAAGQVRLPEYLNRDREYGECQHKARNSPPSHHHNGQKNCIWGKSHREQLDEQPGHRLGPAGDLICLAHQGAGGKDHKVTRDKVDKPGHEVRQERRLQRDPAGQGDDYGGEQGGNEYGKSFHGAENQYGQPKKDTNNADSSHKAIILLF